MQILFIDIHLVPNTIDTSVLNENLKKDQRKEIEDDKGEEE